MCTHSWEEGFIISTRTNFHNKFYARNLYIKKNVQHTLTIISLANSIADKRNFQRERFVS